MEHAAITQRISNLQAGLETWRDFLNKIAALTNTYEEQVKQIETVFSDIHKAVSENGNLPLSHTGMQNRLENLRVSNNSFLFILLNICILLLNIYFLR